jgi:uncharacterized membrane protein (UPF0127 family)
MNLGSPKRKDFSMQGNDLRRRVILGTLWVILACGGCRREPEVILHPRNGAAVRVPVELALTPEMRGRGLMYRTELAADAGMLFVFPRSDTQSFWMKNTPLSLDMIFIGEDLIVAGIVEDAVPFSTTALGVGRPSLYVLEVHAGFAKAHNIRTGDRTELVNVPGGAS